MHFLKRKIIKTPYLLPALRISLLYALLGILWITFSDRLLHQQVSDLNRLMELQTYKGWFYVSSTGLLLYFLLRRELRVREQAEALLERERNFVSAVLDTAGALVIVVNREGRIIKFNRTYEKITGYSFDEVKGRHFWELFLIPEEVEPVKAVFERLKTGKFPIEHENYLVTRNGDRRLVAWSNTVLFDNEGSVEHIIGTGIDITERMRVEEALRESEASYKELADSITDVFFAMDKDLRYTYWNRASENLTGILVQEAIGKSLYELFPEVRGTKADKLYLQALKTQQLQSFVNEFQLEGKNFFFEINAYPSKHGISVFVKDITERKRAEDELRKHRVHLEKLVNERTGELKTANEQLQQEITERKQLEKEMTRLERLNLIGKMAAGIAHEIRNPMTTVRGFLQLFKSKNEFAQSKEYLELMIKELDMANSIITEYLSLAKNKAVAVKEQSLNSIIEAMFPLMQVDATNSEKFINLELTEIPDLHLNEKEMRQLILNLVRNGLEAMSPGGNLTIRTFMDGEEVVLTVQDQGIGIEPDMLKKIGIPFFTTKDHGTGLGLAVCYSIAARHNAAIELETSPTGTTFFVRFRK